MLKTNVDKIIELIKQKKDISMQDISKQLNIPMSNVEQTAKYLEDDSLIKIEYKFMKPHVILVEKEEQPKKELKVESEKSPIKPTKNLLETEVKNQENIKFDESKYSSLEKKDISSTTYSKDLTKKEEAVKKPIEPPTTAQIPQKKEEQKKEETVPKEEPKKEVKEELSKEPEKKKEIKWPTKKVEIKEEKPKIEDKNTNYYKLSQMGDSKELFADKNYLLNELSDLEKIDFMIEEANKKLDEDKITNISKIYTEIYNEFAQLKDISKNEKEILTDKISKLFNRIKIRFLEEKSY